MITENPKVQKEIKEIVDNRVVSWVFIEYLKKCEREIRARIIYSIIEFTLGSMFAYKIISFIFRKEIAELIDNVQSISKKSILALVDKVSKFRSKKK